MVWQMDDTKFFNENRAKIIPEIGSNIAATKNASLTKPSDAANAATNANQSHQDKLRDESNYYITALNTRRNPDLIFPGGAIRGNMYFRKDVNENAKESEEESQDDKKAKDAPLSDDDIADAAIDDMFSKLQGQTSRYYLDSNPTIKCYRCKEFGHMTRSCPNERK